MWSHEGLVLITFSVLRELQILYLLKCVLVFFVIAVVRFFFFTWKRKNLKTEKQNNKKVSIQYRICVNKKAKCMCVILTGISFSLHFDTVYEFVST